MAPLKALKLRFPSFPCRFSRDLYIRVTSSDCLSHQAHHPLAGSVFLLKTSRSPPLIPAMYFTSFLRDSISYWVVMAICSIIRGARPAGVLHFFVVSLCTPP